MGQITYGQLLNKTKQQNNSVSFIIVTQFSTFVKKRNPHTKKGGWTQSKWQRTKSMFSNKMVLSSIACQAGGLVERSSDCAYQTRLCCCVPVTGEGGPLSACPLQRVWASQCRGCIKVLSPRVARAPWLRLELSLDLVGSILSPNPQSCPRLKFTESGDTSRAPAMCPGWCRESGPWKRDAVPGLEPLSWGSQTHKQMIRAHRGACKVPHPGRRGTSSAPSRHLPAALRANVAVLPKRKEAWGDVSVQHGMTHINPHKRPAHIRHRYTHHTSHIDTH